MQAIHKHIGIFKTQRQPDYSLLQAVFTPYFTLLGPEASDIKISSCPISCNRGFKHPGGWVGLPQAFQPPMTAG